MKHKLSLDSAILAAVATHPAHGWEIARRIREAEIKCPENRLYPVLHQLEDAGLLAAEWVIQEGAPNRKVYSITEEGKGALREHRKAWTEYVRSVSILMNPVQEARHA
jgi:PadR family transcriptional regulator, regulatory protein PadR